MRRLVSRFLLVALAVAVAVAVWRVAAGGRGGAVVALDGLRAEALRHEAFALSGPARLAADAAGSFEERPDTALAAFGWIVRRSDGAVVWRQRPGPRPARGLVSATRDTVALGAGTYDAYFASYGDPLVRALAADTAVAAPTFGSRIREALSRGGRAWQGEAGRWHLRLTGATAADRALARSLGDDAPDAEATPDVVWTSGPLGSRRRASALLRVTAPAEVAVEAVLEATGGVVADSAALVRLGATPDTVWAFAEAGSAWAGGSVKNRRARATVRLEPGLYRASARTDGTHAAGDWAANPPWAPWTWGLRVRRVGGDAADVAVLDPTAVAGPGAAGLPVLAAIRCVGSDETREAGFTLTAPTEALLVAAGEVSTSGAYDFATLLRDDVPVWTMDRRDTEPAGGRESNRRAAAPLSLAPGDYTLRYETDDSHDCQDDYSSGGSPDDASFWGAVLVAVGPDFDPATVRPRLIRSLRQPDSLDGEDGDEDESGGPPNRASERSGEASGGEALVAFSRVGSGAVRVAQFALDRETRVRVVAVGELLPGARLDWGRIEGADGEAVWEMTRANTRPAGGAPKNRVFEGVLTLGAGRYAAFYETNGRHAYGDFEGGAPDDPDAWGLRVERLPDDADGEPVDL